ncbi:MAG: GNAT family N-acetyltransferase [Pseudomonadota bacterium]
MTETSNSAWPKKPLILSDRLALISLIEEGVRLGSSDTPVVADLFNELWELVDKTVHGSRIDRYKPQTNGNGFQTLEIKAETGETLGRLNMLYLNKPIPCYYLVYVEVAPPFRRQGLGTRILKYFGDFLHQKSAVGILDNIIPREDPTYGIYLKQFWRPVHEIIGQVFSEDGAEYMIYIPPRLADRDLRGPVIKLIHHLKRKRATIDMRDNEIMVKQTIAEFRDLYQALLAYFGPELKRGESTSLLRFMFTRFVTKLISFRRRIGDLLGYTGGDSLEQMQLDAEVAALPIQSYAPRELSSRFSIDSENRSLAVSVLGDLKQDPAQTIEALPNYRRPSLVAWLNRRGLDPHQTLTIGDLMDLGFDPTRLKEIILEGQPYIFERIQTRQLPDLVKRRELLERLAAKSPGARAGNARLLVNPPLLTIRDRGNAYVLRRKIEGVHWEEALEQLQS